MSLFGALSTAISGLNAQSAAFGNISDNVANSQTTGYKRVDTSFQDYLTTSTATVNESGAVVAQPDYVNNVQGTVSQSDNPLALAITGQGFFAVSQATGIVNNVPTFDPEQYYTRNGNFSMNAEGYLVNTAGQYLNGWTADISKGAINQNALVPIQVTQTSYNPQATTKVTLSANLPATPASGTATTTSPLSSQITVYDSLGTAQTIDLNWSQTSSNDWTLDIKAVSNTGTTTDCGSADIVFGSTTGITVPDGTIGSVVSDPSSSLALTTSDATSPTAGSAAWLQFNAPFGSSGSQPIMLNLGTYGGTSGLTQYAGTTYNLEGLTQDGVPPGSYSSVTMQENGDVVVNYNNGQSRTIAQIPLVTFNDPNQLQRQNGQAFSATTTSGQPLANAVNTNGAGSLVTSSVENSNVDIATEFSQLIVAQEAYSANAKVVTSSDQMLQVTINMKT